MSASKKSWDTHCWVSIFFTVSTNKVDNNIIIAMSFKTLIIKFLVFILSTPFLFKRMGGWHSHQMFLDSLLHNTINKARVIREINKIFICGHIKMLVFLIWIKIIDYKVIIVILTLVSDFIVSINYNWLWDLP